MRDRSEPVGPMVELPLFGGATPSPRAPLAVRRSALQEASLPDAQLRPAARGFESPALRRVHPRAEPLLALASAADAPESTADASAAGAPASAPRRLLAGIIDAAIVTAIDLLVLHFTLRLCGLDFNEALLLPLVPFVVFLLLLNGGYVAAFTAASGQTIGKMAAGIKVVGAPGSEAEARDRVSFGFAVLRTAAYLASALPVGLGFLPGLVGRERRALHDRLAETRVVRVSPAV